MAKKNPKEIAKLEEIKALLQQLKGLVEDDSEWVLAEYYSEHPEGLQEVLEEYVAGLPDDDAGSAKLQQLLWWLQGRLGYWKGKSDILVSLRAAIKRKADKLDRLRSARAYIRRLFKRWLLRANTKEEEGLVEEIDGTLEKLSLLRLYFQDYIKELKRLAIVEGLELYDEEEEEPFDASSEESGAVEEAEEVEAILQKAYRPTEEKSLFGAVAYSNSSPEADIRALLHEKLPNIKERQEDSLEALAQTEFAIGAGKVMQGELMEQLVSVKQVTSVEQSPSLERLQSIDQQLLEIEEEIRSLDPELMAMIEAEALQNSEEQGQNVDMSAKEEVPVATTFGAEDTQTELEVPMSLDAFMVTGNTAPDGVEKTEIKTAKHHHKGGVDQTMGMGVGTNPNSSYQS